MKKIFCGVFLYIFCNISYAALIEVTLGGTLVFNNRSYGLQFPCSTTCSLAPIESNYTNTGTGDYYTITSTLSIPAGLVIAKIGGYSVSVSSNINVTSVSTCDSKPRIPTVFPTPCQSNNPIDVAIPLTIDKGAVITHNTIRIRDTRQSWLNASSSVGSIQLTGDITASNITYASANSIRASLSTTIGNDINSSISINGPTATSLYGTATYFTGTETASTMDSKLIPTALDASFDGDIITHNIEKKYIGSADKLNITSIYTFSDGNLCSSYDCMYTNENAKVNVQCPDEKATLEFKPASYVSGGNIGNLVGSWGNVNIDTTCAITVLIPYE
ncbi:TPA: hypothetical protein NNV11_001766 [Salmonella enterica]|nr:hypothetical protein [Salmonella enterica]